jgi:uncharacterized protein (DUF1778 family)
MEHDQTEVIEVTSQEFQKLTEALDKPAEPNEALKKAMARVRNADH